MKRTLAAILLLASASATHVLAADGIVSRWVQVGPGGTAEARLVTAAPICPTLTIDHALAGMRERAAPDGAFNVRLCSATIPKAAKSASVAGEPFPLWKASPDRIVVIGDTGCRIKGSAVQDCNDAAKWPFPQIAREAAKLKPDLIIHVGDYLYRENACPAGDKGCAGTPSGDNWPTWNVDFFAPAAPLLAAAPWVIVRGNHEDCTRSGAGWLRLLGPLSFREGETCADHLAPYAVPLGPMSLIVMDDASAPDTYSDSSLIPAYANDFASLATLAHGPEWVAIHRPIWGAVSGPLGITMGGNRTMIEALKDPHDLDAVNLMLAGHIHTFEALNYADGPPQIIAGNGGDNLDSAPADLSGVNLAGKLVKEGISLPGFGILLMTRDGAAWNLDEYRADGAVARHCRFAARHLDCGKV
ncbi:MAG TPA: metallophosphoesterase, partial [Rhizomicrobium sp.]